MIENPNKIYISEFTGTNGFNGTSHFVITIAASSMEVAQTYVMEHIGFDVQPVWLMGGVYPTIYTSDGLEPKPIQAKILYNGSYHHNTKKKN